MSIPSTGRRDRTGSLALKVASVVVGLAVAACGSAGPTSPTTSSISTAVPSDLEGDTGTTSGDVPDNAVFLSYTDPVQGFSIQYVEGWQVKPAADGVEIRDKDSSETVALVPGATDAARYVSDTDLPALQARTGFSLVKQDTVHVGTSDLTHLNFHMPAPPDPVTGKQVPSTVDRYYVPGDSGLAVVTLSTPDGVDNVDAFRQMIESFAWAS